MKLPEQDRLLKEILAGDELTNFRQASLEQGLNVMRQQQRRRRVVRICVLVTVPLLFGVVLLSRRAPEASKRQIVSANPPTAAIPGPQARSGDIKFITDEELFALFPNRPLALVGKPGQQQLVFLDQPAKSRQP
jgi:hypothetical protein